MNDIVDMAMFVEAKSDQLNSDDLMGGPRTITVTKVTGNDGEQPISIHYQGDGGKPFKPCKTIRRVLLAIWGRYTSEYVGRSMTLYRDDSVTFGGLNVGGIRISHMSHMEKETLVVVLKSKGKKAGVKVQPLVMNKKSAKQSDQGLDAVLATLRNIAKPGQLDALGAAWKNIGPDARKALAAELPALKAACELPADDVPFDPETGEITQPEAAAEHTLATELGLDEHPGAAKADALIACLNKKGADVAALLEEAAFDLAAMRDEDRQRVTEAAERAKEVASV